jgi:hypothetical protein
VQRTSRTHGRELIGDDERCIALAGLLPRPLAETPGLTTGVSAAMRRPGYDPDRPRLLQSAPPTAARALSREVLVAINITTAFVAVMERTPEIGLRRFLGATPRHITAQVLAETAAIGTLGGLVGTALSVLIVLGGVPAALVDLAPRGQSSPAMTPARKAAHSAAV